MRIVNRSGLVAILAGSVACGGGGGTDTSATTTSDATTTSPTTDVTTTEPGTSEGTTTDAATTSAATTSAATSSEATTDATTTDATTTDASSEGTTDASSEGTTDASSEGTTTTDASTTDGGESGGMCQPADASCSQGESCCPGLDCCAGVPIPDGQEYCSVVCPISDRNRKHGFEPIDPAAVLEKVVALPITQWSYDFEDDAIRHIGPMAQDFRAAFGVGKTEKLIFQVDADGVALASIQALHAEIAQLRAEKAEMAVTLAEFQQRLGALEAAR
jgi:Chaperone of endosialidase